MPWPRAKSGRSRRPARSSTRAATTRRFQDVEASWKGSTANSTGRSSRASGREVAEFVYAPLSLTREVQAPQGRRRGGELVLSHLSGSGRDLDGLQAPGRSRPCPPGIAPIQPNPHWKAARRNPASGWWRPWPCCCCWSWWNPSPTAHGAVPPERISMTGGIQPELRSAAQGSPPALAGRARCEPRTATQEPVFFSEPIEIKDGRQEPRRHDQRPREQRLDRRGGRPGERDHRRGGTLRGGLQLLPRFRQRRLLVRGQPHRDRLPQRRSRRDAMCCAWRPSMGRARLPPVRAFSWSSAPGVTRWIYGLLALLAIVAGPRSWPVPRPWPSRAAAGRRACTSNPAPREDDD